MTRARSVPETVTVYVPFRIVKRGGRKEMILPPGASTARPRGDNTLIKALARAFRWKRMLDSGRFSNIADLAHSERITAPFLTRTMRLAQLAPDLVQAILDGTQPRNLTLEALRRPLAMSWIEQNRALTAVSADQVSD